MLYYKLTVLDIRNLMYLKLLFLAIILFFVSGCGGEPEPDDAFAQMRKNMQMHQDYTFGDSVNNLQNRNNKSYKRKRISSEDLNREEKERKKREEAEKKRWLDAGISIEESADWKALGLSPKRAQHWKKTGLSYNTIGVLIKEDVLPSEAISFMNKKFDKNPKAFSDFASPLYEFKDACKNILAATRPKLGKINKKCSEYVELLNYSAVSGYLADEYQDNDLSLEYISKLRRVDSLKSYIRKEIAARAQLCLINNEKINYTLLFPLLESSPTKEEMFFIKKNKLALTDTQRYKSYEYYDFWVNKEKNEEKARIAIIKHQQALKKAKEARLRAESYKMNALAYNKMVASECGEMVTSVPSTGEKVHVEGKVLHIIGKKGSNIFAYVVKNNKDGKRYLIRDPNATKSFSVGTEISWTALTVGRVVSVTLDDDGTASYNHYSEDEKEYYPMLKRLSKCPYHTKSLTLR